MRESSANQGIRAVPLVLPNFLSTFGTEILEKAFSLFVHFPFQLNGNDKRKMAHFYNIPSGMSANEKENKYSILYSLMHD